MVLTRVKLILAGLLLAIPLSRAAEPKLELLVQSGHSDVVTAVSISADGKYVVSGSRDKSVILWDAQTGRKLRSFAGHWDEIECLTLSEDGKRLVSRGLRERGAILWDVETGERLRTIKFDGPVGRISLSRDLKRLVAWLGEDSKGQRQKPGVWDTETGNKIVEFDAKSHYLSNDVSLSADGKRVATTFITDKRAQLWYPERAEKVAVLWDAESGRELRRFGGPRDQVEKVSLSPDGKLLAAHVHSIRPSDQDPNANSLHYEVIIWNADTGERVHTLSSYGKVLRWSADGKRLAVGYDNLWTVVWDVRTGQKLQVCPDEGDKVAAAARESDWKNGASYTLYDACLNGDGTRLVTAVTDSNGIGRNTAILWDVGTGVRLNSFEGRIATNPFAQFCFSADGNLLVTQTAANAGMLWGPHSAPKPQTFGPASVYLSAMSTSADGRLLATATDRITTLWDVETGKKLQVLAGHSDRVTRVSLSADGKRLATASVDKTAVVWDADTGEKLQSVTDTDPIVGASLSADGKWLATASNTKESGKAVVWDVKTGERMRTVSIAKDWFVQAYLSPDGKRLATNGPTYSGGNLIVWDVESGKRLTGIPYRAQPVTGVSMNNDGKLLAAGGDGVDSQLPTLVDLDSNKFLHRFEGHTGAVANVVLRGDGKLLVSSATDGTTRLWDTTSGKELCSLMMLDSGQE